MRKAAQILQQWSRTPQICKKLNQELAEYKALLESARDLSGLGMDGLPHGTQAGNPTQRKALRAIALEESYGEQLEYLYGEVIRTLKTRRFVDGILAEMPPICRQVCEQRYGKQRTWVRVGMELGIADSTAKRWHTMVCRKIERCIESGKGYAEIFEGDTF